MPGWLSAVAALIKAIGAALGILERRQIEASGEAKAEARRAKATDHREDDANEAAKRARADLRGPGAGGLRDKHFRD